MAISVSQSILIIAVCAVCTFAERALPFAVFRGREVPAIIKYLGRVLPMALMATLVMYCMRSISFSAAASFAPQLIAAGVTVALHLWRHSSLLSIFGGTACYMLLVQLVFC